MGGSQTIHLKSDFLQEHCQCVALAKLYFSAIPLFLGFLAKPSLRPEQTIAIHVDYHLVAFLLGVLSSTTLPQCWEWAAGNWDVSSGAEDHLLELTSLLDAYTALRNPAMLSSLRSHKYIWQKPHKSWLPGGWFCRNSLTCLFQICRWSLLQALKSLSSFCSTSCGAGNSSSSAAALLYYFSQSGLGNFWLQGNN